jgi:spore germination cell wall hydrolase CwlJ-like protein
MVYLSRTWQAMGRRATLIVALCLVFALAAGLAFVPKDAGSTSMVFDQPASRKTARNLAATPLPEPLEFKAGIDPATAFQLNAAVPADGGPIPQSRPFVLDMMATDAMTRLNALDCLTAAVYYEAASEPLQGKRAVAQVVLNRVRHPAYPNSVCGVVFQGSERVTGCQFTFTCDGAMARVPSQLGWQIARRVAEQALAGHVEPSVGTATHYHTVWVVPYWRTELTKLTTLGAHIFYRWQGSQGLPTAFFSRHRGLETQPVLLGQRLGGYLLGSTSGLQPEGPGFIVSETALELERQPALPLKPSHLPAPREVAADANESRLLADERHGTLLAK